MCADDIIVLTENACELQKALDAVHDYCGMYKLTVNIKKTKTIEVVRDYIYLGIIMNFNNKFNKAIENN